MVVVVVVSAFVVDAAVVAGGEDFVVAAAAAVAAVAERGPYSMNFVVAVVAEGRWPAVASLESFPYSSSD